MSKIERSTIVGDRTLTLRLEAPDDIDNEVAVMSGGFFGDHSINAHGCDYRRVLEHWNGYVENNTREAIRRAS
jgi:hypothetical protein